MTRFALAVPHWGTFGDPREAARMAQRAEAAGWDGYFTWGGFVSRDDPPATYDPWVILAAVAAATSHMRIGTCIAPLPAFPPHVIASIVASLDVLSDGRMTLGVGIGDVPRSFEMFGQSGDRRTRAAQLDEALEVITRLWSGEQVVHHGEHYVVDGVTLAAVPVQRPRVPIWVGGDSAPAKRRAARWDGWIGPDEDPTGATTADLRRVRDELSNAAHPVDLVWAGELDDVGTADWAMIPLLGSRDACVALVDEGPRRD
ncbi:LLM class flavin-dependent oxidoreductase [Microbacterium hominis]|uniref:LLM class flavin-dependent oxidoreductase n=1 Tax=Microbacterium hominis TaxID=162426 RepID=A0A7D4UG07_9MICO|nr:LLM class flavin-dependent oxidoreductase [Microbacterium hominis]QKJ18969.1 LLM class flavin-dependent oxidoreductase [Microbacterium hominis]